MPWNDVVLIPATVLIFAAITMPPLLCQSRGRATHAFNSFIDASRMLFSRTSFNARPNKLVVFLPEVGPQQTGREIAFFPRF